MKKYLGEFEELVLSMVSILQDDAYGNAIVLKIAESLERQVSLSAVHVTLYRLEDKGFVKSHHGETTAKRGGRRKRIFQITNTGKNMLNDMQSQRLKVWKLLPTLKFVRT
jgi:DNA-binding PadR family transcriptional regulator